MLEIAKKVVDFVMDILETITFVGSIFLVIYLFIAGPNQVRGPSMEPTFVEGDYILTSKITYKFKKVERGDIIVFKSLENPDIEFIKRVIGIPGDQVMISNGEVHVNNKKLVEAYIADETPILEESQMRENEPVTISSNSVFVMGDNRAHSSDSREFGTVPISNIIGTVFYRYYPPPRIGWIKNPFTRFEGQEEIKQLPVRDLSSRILISS